MTCQRVFMVDGRVLENVADPNLTPRPHLITETSSEI